MDTIPSELLKNGGEARTTVLRAYMPEDLGNKGMAEGHNRSSYLYQRKATSSNVRPIVPSA